MRNKNKIMINLLDDKIALFNNINNVDIPKKGWINSIRTALNMTLEQLGKKLGITKQGIKNIENSEANGSISLNSLKEVANALDMQLVYGFVPKDGSIDSLIDRKAKELAKKIVSKTHQTMRLESQSIEDAPLQEAIYDLSQELKRDVNRALWD